MGRFVFLTPLVLQQKKSVTFKVRKISHYFNLRERTKKKLVDLSSHKYFVVYCLNCLKTPKQKIKGISATPTVFSFAAVVWSRHTTHSIPR